MNLERAAMRGRLAETQQQLVRQKVKSEELCTALRQKLNTTLTPVEEIEIDQISVLADELTMSLAELAVLRSDITRLERELR
jgi:hypothetical protein